MNNKERYGRNKPSKERYNRNGQDRAGFKNRTEDYGSPLDETVVFGRNAVKELLASGRDVEKLYISSGEREGSIKMLIGIAGERGIPIMEQDRQKLDSIAHGGRHQELLP